MESFCSSSGTILRYLLYHQVWTWWATTKSKTHPSLPSLPRMKKLWATKMSPGQWEVGGRTVQQERAVLTWMDWTMVITLTTYEGIPPSFPLWKRSQKLTFCRKEIDARSKQHFENFNSTPSNFEVVEIQNNKWVAAVRNNRTVKDHSTFVYRHYLNSHCQRYTCYIERESKLHPVHLLS